MYRQPPKSPSILIPLASSPSCPYRPHRVPIMLAPPSPHSAITVAAFVKIERANGAYKNDIKH
ncbi:MAG: hypothetical protein LBB09_01385 [Rickettsiales bacterium]|nr:hypothetical protein [Rickettsiales bacterium]